MLNNKIENLIKSLDITSAALKATDSIIFFDDRSSRFYAIDNSDCSRGHYDSFFEIRKLSDMNSLGKIYFANIDGFISEYPESGLETYIRSVHTFKAILDMDKYAAAYAKLYTSYKSLAVLARRGFSDFIDTFIDTCFIEKTDHPATICYFGNEPYKILKLRKAVFDMYEPYLHDYKTYRFIYDLQSHYKYSDKQLRKVKKELLGKAEPDLMIPKEKESKSGLKLLA